MKRPCPLLIIAGILLSALVSAAAGQDSAGDLSAQFRSPPQSARPWVYWFWLNSNLTREGITADLEAMKAAGIGGVLIMEVDQGAPVGPVAFASPKWRELFKHVCSEAARLGLEVNMNNDAGWNGSGGPWIKPQLSMQKIVWTEKKVEGPRQFAEKLARPRAVANYYEDITVMAFPTPADDARIPDIGDRAGYWAGLAALPAPAHWPKTPNDEAIGPKKVVTLTSNMDKDGKLTWNVPPGKWTILRVGHTSTGVQNAPAPATGRGLECDKMSKEAAEVHFANLMGRIIADSGPLVGKSLVATHIDSWENGAQNWTPKFREEFKNRRGYDLMPYLPVMTGRIVGSREMSERFLWDVRQTINELVLQNYAGHFREMAHRHGLRLSIEAYTSCPCDELAYGGCADEPMGEFWSWWFGTNKKYGFTFSCTEMASAAHVYGKKLVGAEAFTACDSERWLGHPGNIKDLGDFAFCEGINRFVFHRYAMQPFLNARPGMSMGPWGLHYERTQTWWQMSNAWHEYLARCQHLLRQGLFVADVCYLGAEASPQSIIGQKRFLAKTPDPLDPNNPDYPRERIDYSFDVCSTEALLTRMSVKDGRLVLPDGMSYRLLVLPNVETMTPKLLGKIKELTEAGAAIVGSRPSKSPSLSDFPQCDAEVQSLAEQIWGPGEAPEQLSERPLGQGRVFWSTAFQKKSRVAPLAAELLGRARWIWYPEGNPAVSAPPGKRYFRQLFAVDGEVKSAQLAMTADNEFTVSINGRLVGSGDTHTRLFTFDVSSVLKQGKNLVAVEAVNTTDNPSPAGLIGALTIDYKDGHKQTIVTDKKWASCNKADETWGSAAAAGYSWVAAKPLGRLGIAPWGSLDPASDNTTLYAEVAPVAEVLKKMAVPPDFTYQAQSGTKSLRYIHRKVDGVDIYFIANKYPRPEQAVCSFRVSGKRPELWHPDSGQIERPAAYDEADGAVRMPIAFESVGSVFVIFRENAAPAAERVVSVARDGKVLFSTAWKNDTPPVDEKRPPLPVEESGVTLAVDQANHLSIQSSKPGNYALTFADGSARQVEVARLPSPIELNTDWDVAFSPKDGGPEHVKFDKLISWSDHSDKGVKYYSGTARYMNMFTVPADQIGKGRRFTLDLGRVEVMAEVTLNQKPLGILWKTPYRIEIDDAIQPGDNTLEVRVVNLWVNRQIGDEFLPEDSDRNPNGTLKSWPKWLLEGKSSPTGRYSFTSWRRWHKNDPLQPSGLIGPVRIVPVAHVEP
jgi:hypothetical protein